MEYQMELITWYENYSVNNDEIDNQHKTLFNIINMLYEHCMITDIANRLAEELVSYSNCHISQEEQYMRSIGCNNIDEHLYKNKIFIQKTSQLQQVVNREDFELTKELTMFLGYWLLNHVMEEDKRLAN
jgi:hemerythrin